LHYATIENLSFWEQVREKYNKSKKKKERKEKTGKGQQFLASDKAIQNLLLHFLRPLLPLLSLSLGS
jgi:hypothetical protein